MSTKPSSPELRPNRYDALVVLVVLALAAALAVRPFLAARAPQSGALTVVVSADGQELDRLPLAQFGTHTYANNGYTLTVTAAAARCRSRRATARGRTASTPARSPARGRASCACPRASWWSWSAPPTATTS